MRFPPYFRSCGRFRALPTNRCTTPSTWAVGMGRLRFPPKKRGRGDRFLKRERGRGVRVGKDDGRQGRATPMKNIAVFASGGGTDFQFGHRRQRAGKILRHQIPDRLQARNRRDREGKKKRGFPRRFSAKADYPSLEELYEKTRRPFGGGGGGLHRPRGLAEKSSPRPLSGVLRPYHQYPSLPHSPPFAARDFYGLKVHEAALSYGVKVTGRPTVHFRLGGRGRRGDRHAKARARSGRGHPRNAARAGFLETEHRILPLCVKLLCEGKNRKTGQAGICSTIEKRDDIREMRGEREKMRDGRKCGEYIRKKRVERGLTRSELAKKLGVGVYDVDGWEAGFFPPETMVRPLAEALGVQGGGPPCGRGRRGAGKKSKPPARGSRKRRGEEEKAEETREAEKNGCGACAPRPSPRPPKYRQSPRKSRKKPKKIGKAITTK